LGDGTIVGIIIEFLVWKRRVFWIETLPRKQRFLIKH